MKKTAAFVALLVAASPAFAACYNDGDTVTLTGKIKTGHTSADESRDGQAHSYSALHTDKPYCLNASDDGEAVPMTSDVTIAPGTGVADHHFVDGTPVSITGELEQTNGGGPMILYKKLSRK